MTSSMKPTSTMNSWYSAWGKWKSPSGGANRYPRRLFSLKIFLLSVLGPVSVLLLVGVYDENLLGQD
eukprot:scaffold118876_cov45-Prasinocladus_malaysianus.AAC.1